MRDALTRAGVRLTHQRLEIYRAVAQTDEHPDAEAVFRAVREKLPTVSLDTVYRTLWLLKDLGLVATVGPHLERVRFDGDVTPHHHFVCTRCGSVTDFGSHELHELDVSSAVSDIGTVTRTQVSAEGVCRRCAEGPA